MAIKEFLSLEGDDIVIQKLDNVQKKGEESLKSFRDLGQQSGGAFDRLTEGSKKFSAGMDEAGEKTTKFGTALKALSSGLRLVGVDLGNVGGAARLLNTSLVGAGAAIIGGAVVALGKLEEAAARTRGELADTFGSEAKGKQAFDALTQSAIQFGSSVGSLAEPLNSLQTALNNVDRSAKGFRALRREDLPFGNVQDVKASTEALNNFIKILRAGRLSQDEAEKSAKAFFDAFRDGGPITSAALRNLPVGTLQLLQQALGAAGQSSKEFFAAVDAGAVPLDKFVAALQKFGPEAEKAFNTKAIKTMGDALGQILETLNAGFQKLGGVSFNQFIIQQLEGINKGLKDANQELQDILDKDAQLKGAALLRLTGGVTTGPTLEQAFAPGVAPFPTPEQAGRAGADAGEAFRKGFEGKAGFIDVSKNMQDAGDKAGALFGKSFVDNPFFKDLPQEVEQPLSDAMRQALLQPIVVPTEPQEQLVNQFRETGGKAGTAAREAIQQGIVSNPLDFAAWITALDNAGNALADRARAAYETLKQIFAQPITVEIQGRASGGFMGQEFNTAFARGGRVSGPGTTTSDNILALLSNREWVINAKAVDFYGSGLFAALNSMRLPRNFAMPKFAEGGQATVPSSSLTLVLGGRSFETTASESTVTALRRFAVHSQLASIGRKPGFVR